MKATKKTQEETDYAHVFEQYLVICNQAIEKNRNTFPYTEIWRSRFETLEAEATLRAIVYDDRPKLDCTLRLTKDMKIEIVEKKAIPADDDWPFTYQYLKRVVDHPQEYINHPAKLEWGWLKNVFG